MRVLAAAGLSLVNSPGGLGGQWYGGDVRFFECDARVSIVNDTVVNITDMQGQTSAFTMYRQVKTSELE